MTKKYLNALAADLAIERRDLTRIKDDTVRVASLVTFDATVDTLITGLQRANPRVDRDRFKAAVQKEAA
jgi:hypothetical protein